jgi:exodeoxyribonuclease VII large subunit
LLDDLQDSLCRRMKARARETRIWWDGLSARWAGLRPSQALARRSERTVELARRICERAHLRQQEKRNRLETLLARLRLLSPAAVLTRGYSITTDAATGEILRDSAQTRRGQSLRTQLAKGVVSSVVTEQADRPPDHLPG